ncbi:MAG: HEAT repeat domain-containing protein [Candidatus Geothermincolia bacterium]
MSDSDISQAGTGDALPEAYSRNAVIFIVNAHAATVNMRLYPPTSSMVTETFGKAKEALDVIFADSEEINVATIENSLMVNDVRLADLEQQKAPIRSFVAWMNERGLSIIEFRKGLKGEELQTFFSILSEMSDVQDRAKLTDDLKEQGVEHILVNQRVYVAVTTSDSGEFIGGPQGASAPLDALKDELLMRYLMGKVDLGTVEDRELVDVLSDAGKVGGLLSRFLGEEGNEGGVYMKSQKAEEALGRLADMVSEIDDEALRETMGDQITRVVAEMSPREMTSVLSGRAPENLNIRHVRENVITMLSDNQLLDMIDSLIDEYIEMKDESGDLETEWTKQRLRDLNELLADVRGERGEEISQVIDEKLDEAGIEEERDPHTGKRMLSAYQMLGGPLEEEDVDLGEGVDQTVPRQIRQLYAMEESDLAAGILLKMIENLRQDSAAVRRFAGRLIKETLEGLDDEHALLAVDVLRPRLVEGLESENDYEAFVTELDITARMAELFMKIGRAEDASAMIEVLMAESSEETGKGEELVKYAAAALSELMGPEGMIDIESVLLEEDDSKRMKTIQTLARMGSAALAPLVDLIKDRGQIELRDRALEAIQMAGEPGINALLGELEKDNPWYIYRNVLNVVADLKLVEGLPQVTAMVSNPDERIRREAVRSLARIGSPESLETVKGAASDQSIAVRRTAVRVMGMFRDPGTAQFLLDIINGQGLRGKDEDQGVVESACLALGDLRNKEYVPQLADLLGKGGLFKKSRPDEIRAAACIALGNVGDQSAVPVLEKAAKDPGVMVRSSAEKALRRLKDGITTPEPIMLDEAEQPAAGPFEAAIEPAIEVEPLLPPPMVEQPPAEPEPEPAQPEFEPAPPPAVEPPQEQAFEPLLPPPEQAWEGQQLAEAAEEPADEPTAEVFVQESPSTLEFILSEQGEAAPDVAPQDLVPPMPPPGEETRMEPEYDTSTLEGMILGAEGPVEELQLPPEQEAGEVPQMGPSTLEMIVEEEDALRPAKLSLEPPAETGDMPGHTGASATELPPELADLWPEGSLNGHDYPVPPPPVDSSEQPGQAMPEPEPEEERTMPGQEFGEDEPEQQIGGLPEDDYAPGRTDQPSTMERLLGPGEAPLQEMPPEQAPLAEPGTPEPPPASPPPPSGWK